MSNSTKRVPAIGECWLVRYGGIVKMTVVAVCHEGRAFVCHWYSDNHQMIPIEDMLAPAPPEPPSRVYLFLASIRSIFILAGIWLSLIIATTWACAIVGEYLKRQGVIQ